MIIFGIVLGVCLPLYILLSCLYAESKIEMVKLYFLIDNYLLCLLTVIGGWIGAIIIRRQAHADDNSIIYSGVITFLYFVYIGTFRVLLRRIQWERWQLIIMKIGLVVSAMGYILFAGDVIIYMKNVPAAFIDFIFIYIFGLFSLSYEFFGKFTEIDGTGNLQYHYTAVSEDEGKVQVESAQIIK